MKQLKLTQNFKQFEADLRTQGGWQWSLTDDLKYLIYVPLQFGRRLNRETIVDTPHCYALETDDYTKLKIDAGTNHAVIVEAESIAGSPVFIAFWEEDTRRGGGEDAFSTDDIDDVDLLAGRLKRPLAWDRISQYVREQLSPGTVQLLSSHTGGPNSELKAALVGDLERIANNGRLYDRKRFAGVELSDEAKEDIQDAQRAGGVDLVTSNRYLLRAAYPQEMWRSRYRHLGIFDAKSTLVAELPKQGTRDHQFWRNCSWDYAHARLIIRQAEGRMTIYNYETKDLQHLILAKVELRAQ